MLNYFVKPRINPITKGTLYYGQLSSPLPVNLDQIAQRISATCTVNPADVAAVLTALETQVLYALQDGMSVRLGKVGTFRVTLHSRGTETAEQFHASDIRIVRVRFAPAAYMRKSMSPTHPDVKFTQLQPRAAAQPPPSPESPGPESGLENV